MLSKKYSSFASLVIYQIYLRSFLDSNNDGIGDLKGVISKLEYIKELGANAIWLCPCFESPNKDNGYDVSDYYQISKDYGTMKDLELLIKKAHKLDIKVILDLVPNHTSNEHFYFKEALKGGDNPYHDYYYWFDEIPNDLKSCFGGSAYQYVESLKKYYLHSFAIEQPDLNWNNPKVREEIKNIIDFYFKKGVDGFRVDVLDMVSKNFDGNKERTDKILHEYIKEVFGRENCQEKFFIGECWSSNVDNLKLFTKEERKELSCSFQGDCLWPEENFKFHKHKYSLFNVAKALNKWQKISYEEDLLYALFLENHDNSRVIERLGDENYRYESATMLATMFYLLRGVSFIYQGQEIGLTNSFHESIDEFNDIETINYYLENKDKQSIKDLLEGFNYGSRDNARRPFPWNDSLNGGFTKGKPWLSLYSKYQEINLNNDLSSNKSIYKFYQKLFKLKLSTSALINGDYQEILLNEECYIYQRKNEKEIYIVIINFDKISLINLEAFESYQIILSNNNRTGLDESFKPYECLVLKSR